MSWGTNWNWALIAPVSPSKAMIDEVPMFLPGRTDPFHGPGLPVGQKIRFWFSSYAPVV